jgi:iron complex outermembrane receptor protein
MSTVRIRAARTAAAVLVLASSICVGHASAQDEAVVVDATRFPDETRRLPASVTVLNTEDIARSSARTLPELLSEQVGIGMVDLYGNNAALTSVDMRGFGVTGPQNTLVLVDGRRIGDIDLSGVQWPAIPLASIERVEILRGSGAVLYGDGASAGVINIVTRSPLAQGRRLELAARTASLNTREAQLRGVLAEADFGVTASVHGYTSDGYRANNRNEQQNGAMNLRWGLGEGALDLRFGVDRQDLRLPGARRIQPSAGLDEYSSDPRGAQTPLDYASRDGRRVGATLMNRIGDAELSFGFDWREKEQRSYFDQGGFPVYRADFLDVTSLAPRVRIPFGSGPVRHGLTLGFDRNAWRYDSRRGTSPDNVSLPVNRVCASVDSDAIYLRDLVDLGAATQFVLGMRAEQVTFDTSDTLNLLAPGASPFSTAAAPARETQTARAWELGGRRRLSAGWTVFARTGTSYRFVNIDEVYEYDAGGNSQFQILRPQHARTYEAGAEWRMNTAFARATLFRTNVFDEIHLDPFSTGVGNTNLPPSRRQGLELDGRWQASTVLHLHATYAFTDARFLEGTLPGSIYAIGTDLELAGRRVPLVPRHKINVGLSWDAAPRTRLSGSLTAVGAQYMDNDEPNTLGTMIPGYTVIDLKLSQSLSWGRLALAVNNLFDERYYTYGVRSAFTADRYSVYPLPGRTISLAAEIALD